MVRLGKRRMSSKLSSRARSTNPPIASRHDAASTRATPRCAIKNKSGSAVTRSASRCGGWKRIWKPGGSIRTSGKDWFALSLMEPSPQLLTGWPKCFMIRKLNYSAKLKFPISRPSSLNGRSALAPVVLLDTQAHQSRDEGVCPRRAIDRHRRTIMAMVGTAA